MTHDNPFAAPPSPEAETDHAARAATTAVPSLEEQLAALQARLGEANDSYLRAKAEAENTRRRSEEEISKARKFSIEGFADSLLPVRDSLEAAIAIEKATPEQLLDACTPRCAS